MVKKNIKMDKTGKIDKSNKIKGNQHFMDTLPLDFDNFTTEELIAKTDKEKSMLFLDKYKKIVNPIKVYYDFFEKNEISRTFHFIKTNYIKLVLNGDWTERKFVASINNILGNNAFLSEKNLVENGRNFDNGNLVNRNKSRRRRL